MASYCYLLNLEDNTEFELISIQENSTGLSVNFDQTEVYRGVGLTTFEFKSVSSERRSFTVGINSRLQKNINCDRVFEQFKKLCSPPKLLGFQWGENDVFSPCVISGDVRYTKKNWNESGTVEAELSFTLVKVPKNMII